MLGHPLFLLSFTLYACLMAMRATGWHLPFFHTHFTDFLCMPVLLPIAHFLLQTLLPRQTPAAFSFAHVLAAVLFYSLLFEGLFPILSTSATADPLDILAYLLGGLVFWRFINRDFVSSPPN
ncbi:MAG: magnesium citrate secondary transporter [Bacteroidota bacterium]